MCAKTLLALAMRDIHRLPAPGAHEPLVGGLAAHAGHRGGVRDAHAAAHALAGRPIPLGVSISSGYRGVGGPFSLSVQAAHGMRGLPIAIIQV